MFGKHKVLTKEYMQNYKAKRCVQNPRMENKIRKYLIRKINKELKIGIKYGEKVGSLKLSKYNVLNRSLAKKTDDEYYKRILLELIGEYESNGIKAYEQPSYKDIYYIFDLEGVFDNSN